MAYEWEDFVDYLDGTAPITREQRDELWAALEDLLGRCGGRWQLAGDMEEIKSSAWITDLTVVENTEDAEDYHEGDLAVVLISIEDTFTGTTGYEAFKAVAPDEGLDDTTLAEIINESGRVQGADDFKLWNLYKRVLDYLQCCPTSAPAFVYDSVSGSKTKYGFPEWTNVSSPSRVFLQLTWSGRIACIDYTAPFCTTLYREDEDFISGTARADPSAPGVEEPGGSLTIRRVLTESGTVVSDVTDPQPAYVGGTIGNSGILRLCGAPTTTTATTVTGNDSSSACGPSQAKIVQLDSRVATLSDEYDDAMLEAAVRDALLPFDDDRNDTAGSYRNLTGITLDLRLAKGFVPLAGLGLSVGRTYDIIYVERWSPSVGPSEDSEERTLSFTYTEGMTHAGPVDLTDPTANGGYTLHVVRWECPEEDEE